MATVTGMTAQRMYEIEQSCIVSGAVDLNGDLQLTRKDGTQYNAGMVRDTDGLNLINARMDTLESRQQEKIDKISGVATNLTSDTLRLTSTGDASATSTTHAFQIGPDTGTHVIMDNNEMIVRSPTNDAAYGIFLNESPNGIFIGPDYISTPKPVVINSSKNATGTSTDNGLTLANGDYRLKLGDDNIDSYDAAGGGRTLVLNQNSDGMVTIGANVPFTNNRSVVTRDQLTTVVTYTGSLTAGSTYTKTPTYTAYKIGRLVHLQVEWLVNTAWTVTGANFATFTNLPIELRPLLETPFTNGGAGSFLGLLGTNGAGSITNNFQAEVANTAHRISVTYIAYSNQYS